MVFCFDSLERVGPNAVDNDLDVDKSKETLKNDERPSVVAIMREKHFQFGSIYGETREVS